MEPVAQHSRIRPWLLALLCLCAACSEAKATHSITGLSAGSATVFDTTRDAFSLPIPNLSVAHRSSFFVGNSFFNQNWVEAPASVTTRDGLGPLFNARSCSGCHFKDGRGRPPDEGKPLDSMLVRVSIPGQSPLGAPWPDPVYGDQIQGDALPGLAAEAQVVIEYEEHEGRYSDGERYRLRAPRYRLAQLGYGPHHATLLMSARVAPALIGLGLLEAVPEGLLAARTDPDDRDGDGISGRENGVWNVSLGRKVMGRFGWKAEQPSVEQQSAGAFAGDMGLTSRLFPQENHSSAQGASFRRESGGSPEVSDAILRDVVIYARTLAVPAQRLLNENVRFEGPRLFERLGCERCHSSKLVTGSVSDLPELSAQEIHPYSDLLLHDMGPGLSDGRASYDAEGSEWRTAPLWGLGLYRKVNGHTLLLHDGRARGVAEAVLWHRGEADAARRAFVALSAHERKVLVQFVEGL